MSANRRAAVIVLFTLAPLVGAGCPTDDDAVVALEDVEIDDNPNSVISCYVRWATDEPATSRVEFGVDGLNWFVGDDELVTEHEVFVFGMRAEREYRLQAVSVTAGGTEMRSAELGYDTGELPFPVANTVVTTIDTDRVQPGWTLANFVVNLTVSRVVAVMMDMDAEVVWYRDLGEDKGRADVEVSLLEDDVVLIGGAVPAEQTPIEVDLAGNVLWEGPVQTDGVLANLDGMHHTFQKLPSGEYVMMRFEFEGGHINDVVERIDPDLNVSWSWSSFEHEDVLGTAYPGGNYVIVPPDDDSFYYNARMLKTLYKVDRTSGEVLWALGSGGDFAPIPDAPETWFLGTHSPKLDDDGHLLIYDNGAPGAREYSRAVEYVIDESAMTAELVWEYPGDLAEDVWFNHVWGDADRLPNGNTLITAGSMLEGDSQSRIMEVTHEGDKVWQVLLSGDGGNDLGGAYMSERIPVLVGRL